VIEPNRLTLPGETAARARVEALFARIDELGTALLLMPVETPDLEARAAGVLDLETLADRLGRGPLLDEARQRVRDGFLLRTVSRQPPAWTGTQPLISSGTVDDQVARLTALEDVVAVAVVEDQLDPGTAAFLSGPGLRALGLPVLEPDARVPGAAGDASAALDGEAAPARDEEDAEEAAAAAEAEAEAIEAQAALRQRRAVLFVTAMAIAVPLGVAAGISLPLMVVIGLAALFLAWVFA
jgi:hypothetical protein